MDHLTASLSMMNCAAGTVAGFAATYAWLKWKEDKVFSVGLGVIAFLVAILPFVANPLDMQREEPATEIRIDSEA